MLTRALFVAHLLLAICCLGCESKSNPSPIPAKLENSESPSTTTELIEFKRFPAELELAVALRSEYLDKLKMVSAAAVEPTADQLRTLLVANQEQILRAIELSNSVEGTLAPEPVRANVETNPDQHMNFPRARLLNTVRTLNADAIRCWEAGQPNECASRFAASLRLSNFLLSQSDDRSRFDGGLALVPTVFEIDGRVADGIAAELSVAAAEDLAESVKQIDETRLIHSAGETPFAAALARCRNAFSTQTDQK